MGFSKSRKRGCFHGVLQIARNRISVPNFRNSGARSAPGDFSGYSGVRIWISKRFCSGNTRKLRGCFHGVLLISGSGTSATSPTRSSFLKGAFLGRRCSGMRRGGYIAPKKRLRADAWALGPVFFALAEKVKKIDPAQSKN